MYYYAARSGVKHLTPPIVKQRISMPSKRIKCYWTDLEPIQAVFGADIKYDGILIEMQSMPCVLGNPFPIRLRQIIIDERKQCSNDQTVLNKIKICFSKKYSIFFGFF